MKTKSNSVARKRRTSARTEPDTSGQARSSKVARKGAGGHSTDDIHSEVAASKVSKRGQECRESQSGVASLVTPSAAPRKQSSRASIKSGKISPRAKAGQVPTIGAPAAPFSDGQIVGDSQASLAVALICGDHTPCVTQERAVTAIPYASHPIPAEQLDTIKLIYSEWRERQGLVRAMTRLSLQAQAVLRIGRDKEDAAKNYAIVVKDPMHPEHHIIAPYLAAMEPLSSERGKLEKLLTKSVKQLPIYSWAKGVSGLGEVSLAGLIGECSGNNLVTDEWWSIGQMKSVSALWKRMGVAVVGGIRQQRVKGEAALEHGYVAERRSVLWNIGECIVKAQWRKENTVHAYGKLYGQIKSEMQARNEAGDFADAALAIVERMKKAGNKPNPENAAGRLTPMHINNRAKRHVTKRLLRDLFIEWRRLDADARGELYAPVAEAA